MRRVETTVRIDAEPAQVWTVLTDFPSYPQWSPTLPDIDGALIEGGRLIVTAAGPGGRSWTFRPTVTAVRPGRLLRWRARLFVPGLLTGVHEFVLEPEAGGTRLVHADNFSGVAVPLLGLLAAQNEAGMRDQNAALKRRVESRYGPPARGGTAAPTDRPPPRAGT